MTVTEMNEEIKKLKFQLYLAEQKVEALCYRNRKLFIEYFDRPPDGDSELLQFYIDTGQALKFHNQSELF